MKRGFWVPRAVVTLLATTGLAGVHIARTNRNLGAAPARAAASGVASGNSSSQNVSFVARLDFPVQQPGAVAFGDFNGDGHTDVAVTAALLNHVSVLFGKGDGALQTPVNYTVGIDPVAIAVGDFNGDGKPDIVTANGTSNSVSVLLNQGNGAFQLAPQTNLVIGQSPSALAVGDFNRDGKLDVAVLVALPQLGANAAEVFLGKGDGTFQPGVNYPVGNGSNSIAVGDFNGDGKLDLVTADETGVSVLLGKGDGTFQSASHSPAGNAPHSLAVGDFNNDGKLDVAVANLELQSFSILLGKGDGTFQAPIQSNQGGTQQGALVAADFNGDGKLDLALDGVSEILLGNGDGTFQQLSSLISTGSQGVVGDIAVADLNDDGKPDLVGLNSQNNFVSVLLGIGNGTFQMAETVGVQPRTSHLGTVQTVTTDMNGDGKIDLVASLTNLDNQAGPGGVEVLLGNGIGAFGTPQVTKLLFTGTNDSGLAVGDFNKDGKPDVVVNLGGSVAILLGNGDGSFQAEVDYATPGLVPGQVAVGDFNGDGNPDVIVADASGAMSLLLGKGDGTFGFPTTITVGSVASSFAVGDFNNDGKLDLAIAGFLNLTTNVMTVSVLLGNGDGTFHAPINIPLPGTGTNRSAIAIGDFNKDGNLDLAVANATFVLELLGDGHGNFSVTQLLSDPVRQPFWSVAAADLNGDGNTDIAVGDSQSQHILVLLGAGNGSFGPPSYFGTNFGLGSITVADLNGDGRPDLIGTSGIDLLFNRGAGPATPGAMTSPASLSFGNQSVGTASSPLTITLRNNGVLALAIKNISMTGTNSGDFSQTNDCSTSLAIGNSCGINVTFDPTAAGGRNAMVSITDDASGSPQTIPVSGTGQDVQISASPTSNTVTAGQSAMYSLSISPLSGFNQSISLSCSGAPTAATCSVSPTSVTFNGGNPATATVTVTTMARSLILRGPGRPHLWRRVHFPVGLALLVLMLVFVAGLQRLVTIRQRPPWRNMVATMGLVALLALMIASCGGGGGGGRGANSGTPPGTFNLTVTAKAGSFLRNMKLTLVVN
jgi:FG-GAP-like repeat/Abnormal spindle-like microcephaly-assoc'd, ASPM-SPD-2-Hydin/FG-GAP repeat